MKFVMERDPMGIVRFRGEYDEMELDTLKFSELDLWMLRTIEQRPATSADYLLGLETIFRRHELEQTSWIAPRENEKYAIIYGIFEESAMNKDRIREIFLSNGFTIKEGCDDLKPYVYAAAEALLREAGCGRGPLTPTGEALRDQLVEHRAGVFAYALEADAVGEQTMAMELTETASMLGEVFAMAFPDEDLQKLTDEAFAADEEIMRSINNGNP